MTFTGAVQKAINASAARLLHVHMYIRCTASTTPYMQAFVFPLHTLFLLLLLLQPPTLNHTHTQRHRHSLVVIVIIFRAVYYVFNSVVSFQAMLQFVVAHSVVWIYFLLPSVVHKLHVTHTPRQHCVQPLAA